MYFKPLDYNSKLKFHETNTNHSFREIQRIHSSELTVIKRELTIVRFKELFQRIVFSKLQKKQESLEYNSPK